MLDSRGDLVLHVTRAAGCFAAIVILIFISIRRAETDEVEPEDIVARAVEGVRPRGAAAEAPEHREGGGKCRAMDVHDGAPAAQRFSGRRRLMMNRDVPT